LEELENKRLIENADTVGTYIKEQLATLAAQYPQIGDVRGAGLFIGVEFRHAGTRTPDAAIVTRLVNLLKERGVLIGATGPFANTLRVRPALCLSRDDADFFLAQLKTCLGAVA
jgi:4-aminobutyrate aminotransferase-like enzyme